MAWISSSPSFHVPLPKDLVEIVPIPQIPLLALATKTAVLICHSQSLIPIAVHDRTPECIDSHGNAVQLEVRNVSVDTSRLDQLHTANLFIRTESNFILVYHILVNYSRSLYEVHDKKDDDKLLQNSLPLALLSKFSLTGLFKSATKSILQGGLNIVNLENVEHFGNATNDDEQRNDSIPVVKVTVVKILRMNAAIHNFWCKLNSQTLIFYNDQKEIQVLNMKTIKSEVLTLSENSWFDPDSLVLYNLSTNMFLFIDSALNVMLVEFVLDDDDQLHLEQHKLQQLQTPVQEIHFNPQFDLVILKTKSSYDLYKLGFLGKKHSMAFVKSVYKSDVATTCRWSPCGTFFVIVEVESGFWKLVSRFGAILFNSKAIQSEAGATKPEEPELLSLLGFCLASKILISPNALSLYVIDKSVKNLNVVPLTSQQDCFGQPILYDQNFIKILRADHTFLRVPMIPHYQKALTRLHHINGTSRRLSIRRPTGQLSIRKNSHEQISISYGDRISVSTPIGNGLETYHALWFNFVNHYMESMNIVSHYWADEYLVLINRYVRDDIDDHGHIDLMADELVVLNMADSRYGAGGIDFRFDTDLIVWRHQFKTRILNVEIQNGDDKATKLLVLITGDLKIVITELKKISLGEDDKPGVGIRRSIHLSSIQHKLAIPLITKMAMVQQRHFFFLLSTGDLFLLKNQYPAESDTTNRGSVQTTNMYELVKIQEAVETIHMSQIYFGGSESTPHLTVMTSDEVIVYKAEELVERVHHFEDVSSHPDVKVERPLRPIRVSVSSMQPLTTQEINGAIEVTGFEYQTILKSEHLLIKHRPCRQLILNRFIQHDLFESNIDVELIVKRYRSIPNFDYCLELLLFDFIDDDKNKDLGKVVKLVSSTSRADSIFVNLLRKIEVRYWHQFFQLLNETPLNFMNRLIKSHDVELCYNYLIVYLNFKKEYEAADIPQEEQAILDTEDREIILRLIGLLKDSERWDHCFELCRFIKLLEPSGELLQEIRDQIV